MEIKKGIAASPGICIAEALILDSEDFRIPCRTIRASQRGTEIQRVRDAFRGAIDELTQMESAQTRGTASKIKDIFAVHLRFLRDRNLRKDITNEIQNHSVNAEYAVATVLHRIEEHFSNIQDPYISERAADIRDIQRRLLWQLLGRQREDLADLRREVVVVAHELSPTQTAAFNRQFMEIDISIERLCTMI